MALKLKKKKNTSKSVHPFVSCDATGRHTHIEDIDAEVKPTINNIIG